MKFKKIAALLLASSMLSAALTACNTNSSGNSSTTPAGNTNETTAGNSTNTDITNPPEGYGLTETIEDGAILHCFSWSFKAITESMEDIAMSGFSAIQTSPVNLCYDGGDAGMDLFGAGKWYYHYQPIDWTIGNYQLGTKEEFKERIENNTLDEVLNYVPVKKGDAFFIEAGTIHAIGAGIFIAEVQQHSNTTYRVSDYGRLGADGKPRELHIDKALDVTNTVPVISTKEYSEYKVGGATVKKLASCDKFTASVFSIEGKVFVGNKDTFVHLLVLQGHIIAVCEDGTEYSMYAGESLFVPAGAKIQVLGIGGKVLISHL